MSYASRYDVRATLNRNPYPKQVRNSSERPKINYESNLNYSSKSKKKIIPYTQNITQEKVIINDTPKNPKNFQFGDSVFNKYSNKVMSFIGIAKNDCFILCNKAEQTLNIIPKKYVVPYRPQKNININKPKTQNISPKKKTPQTKPNKNKISDDDDDVILIIN